MVTLSSTVGTALSLVWFDLGTVRRSASDAPEVVRVPAQPERPETGSDNLEGDSDGDHMNGGTENDQLGAGYYCRESLWSTGSSIPIDVPFDSTARHQLTPRSAGCHE